MEHSSQTGSFDGILGKAIQEAIRMKIIRDVDPQLDHMIEEQKKRIIKAHEDAIAEVVIQLMAMASFERIGPDLRITIRNRFAEEKPHV